jgi:hypothetical protein
LLFVPQFFEDRDFRKSQISCANLSARTLLVSRDRVAGGLLTCPVESKPNSKITKTKMIGVMLMAFFDHRQKIAAARRPTKTPSNGLETANQKETRQPDSLAVGFVFTLFSQAFEDRHFTKREISFVMSRASAERFGSTRCG